MEGELAEFGALGADGELMLGADGELLLLGVDGELKLESASPLH